MKLWVLKKECMMILILDTNGVLPTKMQRDLMLCRSLTLPADYLLMGPVQLGKCRPLRHFAPALPLPDMVRL